MRFRVIIKKAMVQIPENIRARLGSRPIMTGKTNVPPNIATTCCAPTPAVFGQLRRSSVMTATPGGGGSTRFHANIDIASSFGVGAGTVASDRYAVAVVSRPRSLRGDGEFSQRSAARQRGSRPTQARCSSHPSRKSISTDPPLSSSMTVSTGRTFPKNRSIIHRLASCALGSRAPTASAGTMTS